jgi:hypothetical protein
MVQLSIAPTTRFPPRLDRRRQTLPAIHRESARWLRHQAVQWGSQLIGSSNSAHDGFNKAVLPTFKGLGCTTRCLRGKQAELWCEAARRYAPVPAATTGGVAWP